MTRAEAIAYINEKECYDLMYSIVHYRNAPNKDNSIALKLLDCLRLFYAEEGSKVIVPDCMSCSGGMHPIAELFVYATKHNLFISEVPEVKNKTKRPRIK